MDTRSNSPVLAYSIKPRRHFPAFFLRASCFIAAICLLLGATRITVHAESHWIDAETGARMDRTSWLGHKCSPVVTTTALDQRLATMGIRHTHQWSFYNETEYNIYGGAILRGCSSMPKIGMMPPDMLKVFVEQSSDSEVKSFIQTMASGS